MITIEQHKGVNVLRDDLLTGGTKSILMPSIIGDDLEYTHLLKNKSRSGNYG